LCDLSEVAPQEIHDHDVLCAILRRFLELARSLSVFFEPSPPRESPFHWPGDELIPSALDKQLRRE
jgi:hypothetical protein